LNEQLSDCVDKNSSKISPDAAHLSIRQRLHTADYSASIIGIQHLNRARNLLAKAQKIYSEGNYSDCLFKIEESMQQVNEEPLSEMLRLSHAKLYSHVLNCHLQSASCYIKLE
jgi:hypothetical protein